MSKLIDRSVDEGGTIHSTFFDASTNQIHEHQRTDIAPVIEDCKHARESFRGYNSEVMNRTYSIPVDVAAEIFKVTGFDLRTAPAKECAEFLNGNTDLSAFRCMPDGKDRI